jgi:hypothetical protein
MPTAPATEYRSSAIKERVTEFTAGLWPQKNRRNEALASVSTSTSDSFGKLGKCMKLTNYSVIGILLSIVCCFGSFAAAQQIKENEVQIRSWKSGDVQIEEQVFDFELDAKTPQALTEINGLSGEKYKLSVLHVPSTEYRLSESGRTTESWIIELTEIFSNNGTCTDAGKNLLKASGHGTGGDDFPREDLVGYLYPKTDSRIKANGLPLIDGKFYYPIRSIRRIRVENFEVSIQVLDYELDNKDNTKVTFMKVRIAFKNV